MNTFQDNVDVFSSHMGDHLEPITKLRMIAAFWCGAAQLVETQVRVCNSMSQDAAKAVVGNLFNEVHSGMQLAVVKLLNSMGSDIKIVNTIEELRGHIPDDELEALLKARNKYKEHDGPKN